MFTFTIELPETIAVDVGNTGLKNVVPIKEIMTAHPDMARFAVVNGFMARLGDISRGKDANDKPLSDAAWQGQREKRIDAWKAGAWHVVTRTESAVAAMREAYVDETRERTGQSVKQVEADMKALVKQAFGDKETATFDRFLDALAGAIAKERKLVTGDVKDKLLAKYQRLADEAAAARAKAGNITLDLSGISLD